MTERHMASSGDNSDASLSRVRPREVDESAIDAAIVQRMALGEDAALGALYDRWADSVHALVSRIVRDDTEAEEVVEAVFWQAWQQASRYAGERGSPAAWLLSMARSRSLDRLRTLRRRREEQPVDDSVFSEVTAVDDPLAELDAADRAQHVAAALSELPAEQRQVLELAYFDGLSQTEISAQLDVPLGTIKTRARLALRKMRDHLYLLRGEAA
jgi:RNA polymerase sigma-70 factor, ECF subfamily